jgi:hypothetical protein
MASFARYRDNRIPGRRRDRSIRHARHRHPQGVTAPRREPAVRRIPAGRGHPRHAVANTRPNNLVVHAARERI